MSEEEEEDQSQKSGGGSEDEEGSEAKQEEQNSGNDDGSERSETDEEQKSHQSGGESEEEEGKSSEKNSNSQNDTNPQQEEDSIQVDAQNYDSTQNTGILRKTVSFSRLHQLKPSISNIQSDVQSVQHQINGMINKLQFSRFFDLAAFDRNQIDSQYNQRACPVKFRHEQLPLSYQQPAYAVDQLNNKSLQQSLVYKNTDYVPQKNDFLARSHVPPTSALQEQAYPKLINQIYSEAYQSAYGSFVKSQQRQSDKSKVPNDTLEGGGMIQQKLEPEFHPAPQDQMLYNEKMDKFIDEFRQKLDLAIIKNQAQQIEHQQQQLQSFQFRSNPAQPSIHSQSLQDRKNLPSAGQSAGHQKLKFEDGKTAATQLNQNPTSEKMKSATQGNKLTRSKIQISQDSQQVIDNYYKFLYKPIQTKLSVQHQAPETIYQQKAGIPKSEAAYLSKQQKFLRSGNNSAV